MREYLSESNLVKAVGLGSIMAVMAAPRILASGMHARLLLPAAMMAMTLTCGAATAWGKSAGMVGVFPKKRRLFLGIGLGLLAAALLMPVKLMYLAPMLKGALIRESSARLAMQFPSTAWGCMGAILWVAGFETIFLCAAPMSFWARISNRIWVAIILTCGLKLMVGALTLSDLDLPIAPMLIGAVTVSCVSSFLFARWGLPATMAFTGGLNAHLFLMMDRV